MHVSVSRLFLNMFNYSNYSGIWLINFAHACSLVFLNCLFVCAVCNKMHLIHPIEILNSKAVGEDLQSKVKLKIRFYTQID